MDVQPFVRFWPRIYAILQELWSITEPHIEESAIRNGIPLELYLYSELGLSNFSPQNFEKRDPFTNPEQFEKVFVRLNIKGWIEPLADGSYRVTERARQAVRHIVRMGDTQLLDFKSVPESELKNLAGLLQQILVEIRAAPEPPAKWALLTRFHTVDENSPLIVQIRDHLLDLFAYRDDAHLAAARPCFNQAGIVWLVLGALWQAEASNPRQMAERLTLRGYETEDYEIALQAAMELGWAEPAERQDTFRLTAEGRRLREQAEELTNRYFYAPWSVLTHEELEALDGRLHTLHHELSAYRRSE